MKKLSLLLAVCVLIFTQACAQKSSKVPANVKSAFTQKFPTAKKAKWDKENATEWEVEFKMNNKSYSANYTNEGMWKETEYAIKKSEIPSAVNATLNSKFSGYKIKESEISETATGKVYEFLLKKGESKLEVAISPSGDVVSNSKVSDESDEND